MIGVIIDLQIISKILKTGDYSIVEDNLLSVDDFKPIDKKHQGYDEEFSFIVNHYEKYGRVPDVETFLERFPDIELAEVNEPDDYLVDAMREKWLYVRAVPVVQNVAKLLKTDANASVSYMLNAVKDLTPDYGIGGIDIIANAELRLKRYKEMRDKKAEFFFTSGFPELDAVINGFKKGEEFVVIFARTNNAKSWVLEKIIAHIWRQGANVGYISPEMSAESIGFRFDTLFKGFSNKDLAWGNDDIDLEEYEKYIQELKNNKAKFVVSTPTDFDNKITVSKLRNFVKQNKLEALAIDGITYMTDERGRRNDNKTTSLTNISEDLMSLSVELGIPVFVVVQANRTGVADADSNNGAPELESIRDSDGISHNASKVFSLRLKDNCLELAVKKHRDGAVGAVLKYLCNINTGEFTYTQRDDEVPEAEHQERRKRKADKGKDIF